MFMHGAQRRTRRRAEVSGGLRKRNQPTAKIRRGSRTENVTSLLDKRETKEPMHAMWPGICAKSIIVTQSQNRKLSELQINWSLARMCKKPKTASFRESARKALTGRMRRANLIDQQSDESEGGTEEERRERGTTREWRRSVTNRSGREDKQSTIL